MSKDASAKYYPNNKERLHKIACERYQSLSKEKKEKSNKMVVNNTKSTKRRKRKTF